MAQTKYTCKDCVLFNDEDSEFQYCLGKDLYTDANPDDDACGDIIPLVYTCKDCFFFNIGFKYCYYFAFFIRYIYIYNFDMLNPINRA